MDTIPTPCRFLAPRYLHVHICIVHGNAISHFATPAISQFHNVSMPQCVNAAHSRCVNARMSQCFFVNASMCKRLMLAMLQLLIGSSGRFLPPILHCSMLHLLNAAGVLHQVPCIPPGPNTQYLVICIYHIFSPLHQFHCCWFHVPCLLPLVSHISCFLCFLFLVLTWLVLCPLCILSPGSCFLSPVSCRLCFVPCPPGRPLSPAIKQASSQYQKLANSQVSKP